MKLPTLPDSWRDAAKGALYAHLHTGPVDVRRLARMFARDARILERDPDAGFRDGAQAYAWMAWQARKGSV